MTANVRTIKNYQNFSTERRNVLIEKLLITLLLLIGICGYTVVTLQANTPPPVDISGLQVTAPADDVTFPVVR